MATRFEDRFEIVTPGAPAPLQDTGSREPYTFAADADGQSLEGPVLEAGSPPAAQAPSDLIAGRFEIVGQPQRGIEHPGALQVAADKVKTGPIPGMMRKGAELAQGALQSDVARGFSQTARAAALGSEVVEPDAPVTAKAAGAVSDWAGGRPVWNAIIEKVDEARGAVVPKATDQFNELWQANGGKIPEDQWLPDDQLQEIYRYGMRFKGTVPDEIMVAVTGRLMRERGNDEP